MAAAVAKWRPAWNGAPIDPDKALAIHRLGARGEAAAKLYLNPVKWNAFADELDGLPDFEDWIDVKTRSKTWYDLPVQKKCPPPWANVLITGESHPHYQIIGWVWARDAMKPEYLSDPAGGREAYFVKQDSPIMRRPADLVALLRQKQHFDKRVEASNV
jgi:hypothetical protein